MACSRKETQVTTVATGERHTMSEPSTHIPGDVADGEVEETSAATEAESTEKVELDIDEEKVEAWDKVKADYQVDPDAEDTPAGTDEDGMDEGNAPG